MRRVHRLTVPVTGIGAVATPGTAACVLPVGATIEETSVAVTDLGTTGGNDVAWTLADSALTLLAYDLDPADPLLTYASEESRPIPVGSLTVSVWLNADAGGLADAAGSVVLDYSTED